MFNQIGLGEWFRYFTGIVEILGAALILIPQTVLIGVALQPAGRSLLTVRVRFSSLSIGEMLRRLVLIHDFMTAEEMQTRVEYL